MGSQYKTLAQLPFSSSASHTLSFAQYTQSSNKDKISIKDKFYLYHINQLEKRLQEQEMIIDKLLKHINLEDEINVTNHSYTEIEKSEVKENCTICSMNFNEGDCLIEIKNNIKNNIKNVHNICLDKMTNFKLNGNILWNNEIDFDFEILNKKKII